PDELSVGGVEYHLIKGPTSVDVRAADEVSAKFVYAVVGELRVEITGVPAGMAADVVVTGPGGYDSGTITASETLRLLPVGTYTVTANNLVPTLYPVKPKQVVIVEAGELATVNVRYRPPVNHLGR